MKYKHRFVVYADFLGTTQRYSAPKLIVRGRELLEQALVQCVVPELNTHDMNLYVFSDTAILTCPRLDPLLMPISRLFAHFIELSDDTRDTSLTLWLRAAISSGKVLQVDHLENSNRIRTIPFLDTSLPTAYNLESIRKGSRIFIDASIRDDQFREHRALILRWQQITGRGEYAANVGECLWPALIYRDNNRLVQMTLKFHRWWSQALDQKQWSRDEYHDHLIHLDETVKLFIRASATVCPDDVKRKLMCQLLPKTSAQHKNTRYKWGIWFQAFKTLVEICEDSVSHSQHAIKTFGTLQDILSKGGFLDHFMQELRFPDYARFRRALSRLGLYSSVYERTY
jgi:hypothetical protein